jgi:DNA-binding response OmpR family regulator
MKCLAADADSLAFAYVDIGLPDASGLDLVAELRKRLPNLPIVVATGRSGDFECLGVVVLKKPFRITEFQTLVDEYIRERPVRERPPTQA